MSTVINQPRQYTYAVVGVN